MADEQKGTEMITTKEAKKIAENIEEVAGELNNLSAKAAKCGVVVKLETSLDQSVDYPYHCVWVDKVAVDLNWISPEQLAELAAEEDA